MVKGIQQNFSPESIPSDYALMIKNGIISEKWDAIINEKGTIVSTIIPSLGITTLYGIYTFQDYILIFYGTSSTQGIAAYNQVSNSITHNLVRSDFNFDINYPISGRAKLNPKGELIIAFVDGFNTNKYINLNTATPADSINLYNLFPISKNPNITVSTLENGGSVSTGAYFISIQYLTPDRARSQWSQFSAPVYIADFNSAAKFTESDGSAGGQASNQGIKINLTELDTSYNKVAISVTSKINGVVSSKIVKEVPYSGSTLNTVWTGTEFLSDVLLTEIITKQPIYDTAKHVVDLNDELLLADLTSTQIDDLQLTVNSIQLKWRSFFSNTTNLVSGSTNKSGNGNKTFMHDEVYAFYIEFELTNGRFTPAYHIPGRVSFANDKAASGLSVYSGGLTVGGSNPIKYQVEDSSLNDGFESIIFQEGGSTNGLLSGCYRGLLGFWENVNETYPNEARWGSLAGQKVRHHKFPSLAKMHDIWFGHGYTNHSINNIDTLGVDVQSFNIPSQYSSLIRGYRISYAKRDYDNAGVLGTAIVQFGANPETATPGTFHSNIVGSAGGNFLVASFSSTTDDIRPNKSWIRLNSFDLMLDKPSVNDIYIDNQIKYRQLLGNAYTSSIPRGTINNGLTGGGGIDVYSFFSNFTLNSYVTKSTVSANDRLRKLSNTKYIPANTQFSDGGIIIDNRWCEETLFGKIEGTALDIDRAGLDPVDTEAALKTNAGTYPYSSGVNIYEETYLCTIKVPRADFFLGFENQTLVPLSRIQRGKSGTNFYRAGFIKEGDTFIGTHSYIALAPIRWDENDGANDNQPDDGIRNPKMFLCESRHNTNLRYKTEGDYSTYFFPSSGDFIQNNIFDWTVLHNQDLVWNTIKYTKDYTSIDDIQALSVYNPYGNNDSDFPYRIIKSQRASSESSLEDGWRNFLAGSYYDIARNKGFISNLEAWGTDILLIHTEKALFRTRDKAVLQTSDINVTLGAGGLFEIEPKETRPTKDGYAGTQHKFAAMLTEVGYFFPDANTGEVFLFNGEIQNITKGFKLFFRDFLGADNNPLNGTGITAAYDKKNYRILLSQKATYNWTVSFDLVKQEWASAHDYAPDFIFNTRDKLYSFKGLSMYTHNVGPRGTFYGLVYPTYIDIVVNEQPDQEKILSAVNWLAKRINSSGAILSSANITHITIWNDKHCTGRIAITSNSKNSLLNELYVNSKVKDELWSFNDFNNRVKNLDSPFISDFFGDFRPLDSNLEVPAWYNSEPMRGKYFIIRLEYDNLADEEIQIRKMIPLLKDSHS